MSIISTMGQYFKLLDAAPVDIKIVPRFIQRPSADRVDYSFEVSSLDGETPQTVTIDMRSINEANLGLNNDFIVGLPSGEEVSITDRSATSVSGTVAYTTDFQVLTLPPDYTITLDPTSVDVPAYIEPIDPENFNNTVYGIHSYSDGKLLVVGSFSLYGSTSANGIIRLNPNGTVDTSFSYGTGFNYSGGSFDIRNLKVDSSGNIYVGGRFSSYNGTSIDNLIKLNSDGSVDSTFITNASGGATGISGGNVDSIVELPGNKYAVGGRFITYGGVTKNSIIVINSDGTLDTGFDVGSGVTSSLGGAVTGVRGMAYDSDLSRLVVVGDFTHASDQSYNRIVGYDLSGNIDTSFVIGTGFAGSYGAGQPRHVEIVSDGYYVVGQFDSYQGVSAPRLIKLQKNGSKDTSFDNSVGFPYGTVALFVISDENEDIYVGGTFTTYKSASNPYMLKISKDGTKDSSFVNTSGFNDYVRTINVENSGILLAAGNFTNYKGTAISKIARLNRQGDLI